ncbi:MAG: hypothetical protein ACTHKL_14595 [Streptosporangiaceae bacterium]
MSEGDTEWVRLASLSGVRLRRTTSLRGSKITGSAGEVLLTRRGRTLTLADGQVLRVDKRYPDRWRVADSSTGDPVLWVCNRHFNRKATGYVIFPGQAGSEDFSERNRDLMFPVKGSRRGNAVMKAVIPASSMTVLWFRRLATREHEVVVVPEWELTPKVLGTIELTAAWLSGYFDVAGSNERRRG